MGRYIAYEVEEEKTEAATAEVSERLKGDGYEGMELKTMVDSMGPHEHLEHPLDAYNVFS